MGAHVDDYWPIDGPARNGRMAWPPYVGTHRADPYAKKVVAWDDARGGESQVLSFDYPEDVTYVAVTTDPPVVHIGPKYVDVWAGDRDVDKYWAKNEPTGENFD